MRVISGQAKGLKLATIEGNQTRPTTDRVKESMFSIIQFFIDDKIVLDLFAGSGALGIEALSRGAMHCDFVEKSKDCFSVLKGNVEKSKLQHKANLNLTSWEVFLCNNKTKYDLVLLDPPYNNFMCDEAIALISSSGLLNDNALIVCEVCANEVVNCEYPLKKEVKYGNTKLLIFENR